MKTYTYRRRKLTDISEYDLGKLHENICELGDTFSKDMTITMSNVVLAATESMKLWPKDRYELDLLLYLETIKPHCRSSSYLDE